MRLPRRAVIRSSSARPSGKLALQPELDDALLSAKRVCDQLGGDQTGPAGPGHWNISSSYPSVSRTPAWT